MTELLNQKREREKGSKGGLKPPSSSGTRSRGGVPQTLTPTNLPPHTAREREERAVAAGDGPRRRRVCGQATTMSSVEGERKRGGVRDREREKEGATDDDGGASTAHHRWPSPGSTGTARASADRQGRAEKREEGRSRQQGEEP